MFKTYYARKAVAMHGELCAKYVVKSGQLAFGARILRAINDPKAVYFEIDEENGMFRIRSANLHDEPGKRKVTHTGVADTPKCDVTCKDLVALIRKFNPTINIDGKLLFPGVFDLQTHSVVFSVKGVERVY